MRPSAPSTSAIGRRSTRMPAGASAGFLGGRDDPDAVGADEQVAAPLRDEQRPLGEVVGLADEHERLRRTSRRRRTRRSCAVRAVPRPDRGQRGQRLDEPAAITTAPRGGIERRGTPNAAAGESEPAAGQRRDGVDGCPVEPCPAVGLELLAAEAPQLERRHAVAGEEAVRGERRGVAGAVAVDEEGRAAGAHQVEGGGEPGGARADDRDVDVEGGAEASVIVSVAPSLMR